MQTNFTHLMVRVTDIPRSVRFYENAFDFVSVRSSRVAGIQDMVGYPHEWVDVNFIEHPSGLTIELVHAPATEAVPAPGEDILGFSGPGHLACRVEDIATVTAQVLKHGGAVVEQSRVTRPGGTQVVFVRDPDGTKIELVQPA